MDSNFHVFGLNMVENMVLLRAPVLTDQADKLGRRNFVQVLHQLLLQAWGANVVHFLWVNQKGPNHLLLESINLFHWRLNAYSATYGY